MKNYALFKKYFKGSLKIEAHDNSDINMHIYNFTREYC